MRKLSNWLDAFIELGQTGEAPDHVLFWSGVSAIAGALQRKVWVDELNFKWFPNMYVVVVAPPGIIAKTTTTGLGMGILKKVEGVHFGPNVTTWQALVEAFKKAARMVEYSPGETVETHSLTVHSGEMGNLIAPEDHIMMDMLNTLWDCGAIEKATVKDGETPLEYPFLNLIACTTPSWISGNFPAYMIDGGLVSRIVWVYAEEKARLVANPIRISQEQRLKDRALRRYLLDDLNTIARLKGEFVPSEEAYLWSEDWYNEHWRVHSKGKDDSRLGGFYSRKQSHIYKLATVLSAARDDSRIITLDDMVQSERKVSSLEGTLLQVFDRIGRTETSNVSDRMVEYISRAGTKGVTIEECFLYMRGSLPKAKDVDDVIKSLQRSRLVVSKVVEGRKVLITPQS